MEYLSYYYPDDYPDVYVKCLEEHKEISIAYLGKHHADLWKLAMAW